jgi:hypothetical protein
MGKIMRRLGTGERWWAAEVAVRATGLALLVLCALAMLWLRQSVLLPPLHQPDALEIADAAGGLLCGSLGGALLGTGPGLFRLVDLPGRHARFPKKGTDQ